MEQQLKRRALSAAIFAGAIVAAGCSGGASGDAGTALPPTTAEVAMLKAISSGVAVNDVDLPYGQTRPVELEQPIHVDTASVANLGAGDIELVLLGTDFPAGADMRLDSWDRPELEVDTQVHLSVVHFDGRGVRERSDTRIELRGVRTALG